MAKTEVLTIAQAVLEYPGTSKRLLLKGFDGQQIEGSRHGRHVWLNRQSLEAFLVKGGRPPKEVQHAANA